MRSFFIGILCLLLTACSPPEYIVNDSESLTLNRDVVVAEYARSASVCITTLYPADTDIEVDIFNPFGFAESIGPKISYGTGVAVVYKDQVYVWTVRHNLELPVKNKDGRRVLVASEFIFSTTFDRKKFWFLAEVIAEDDETDIALLKVTPDKRGQMPVASVYFTDQVPPISTPVIHIGNFNRATDDMSYSRGYISNHNYTTNYANNVDQMILPLDKGSSGGGVFLINGACLGLATAHVPDNQSISFYTPYRELLKFAKQHNVEYALPLSLK